jgi:hypothetical protein
MSKLTEKLNAIKYYNDWDLTKDGHPMIHLRTASKAISRGILLSLKGRRFKDSAWYDNGSKSFHDHFGDHEANLKDALAWVEKRFPGMKMVKSPFGGRYNYIPEEDLKDVLKELEENHENGSGTDQSSG